MGTHCNKYFRAGKLTTILDGAAGSSGKGKLEAYITEHADAFQFVCNTFAPQAGHWVKLDDGRKFFYQTLNSCAYNSDKFEKMYLGPGSMIELSALLREIEENNLPRHKLGISPIVPILDEYIDQGFERGVFGFDGADAASDSLGTMKSGSTAHGVGSCNARRILRRPSLRMAKDVPELREFICDVPAEVMSRLDRGQAGLMSLAQGYQLSLMHDQFYPFVTSRNVTVAQGLSDMFISPIYAGKVILNFRTFPIRISSRKFIAAEDGRHLTWEEVKAGVKHAIFEGNSGGWYEDQREITWEEVTKSSGSLTQIMEITSVTKLPRRVATFSARNVIDAIVHNRTEDGVVLSVNFANYVDANMLGARTLDRLTPKFNAWAEDTLSAFGDLVHFIGTGAPTDDMIYTPDGVMTAIKQPMLALQDGGDR